MKFARNERAWFRCKSRTGNDKLLFHGKLKKEKTESGYRLYSNCGSMNLCYWFKEIFNEYSKKLERKLGHINKLSNIRLYTDIREHNSWIAAHDVNRYLSEYYHKLLEDSYRQYIDNPVYFVQEKKLVYDIEDATKSVTSYVTIEAFLTYAGAQEFINMKQQHYNPLRIHTKSSIGNEEWTVIRRLFINYPEFKYRRNL